MKYNNHRNYRGTGLVEVATMSFVVVAVILMCLDMSMIWYGLFISDAASRDAARAAGQTATYTDGNAAANAAMTGYQSDGYFVTKPKITYFHYVQQNGPSTTPGDDPNFDPTKQSPYVTVTTTSYVRMPVPVSFFGFQVNDKNQLTIEKSYTYPILGSNYTVPPSSVVWQQPAVITATYNPSASVSGVNATGGTNGE
jgi:hypothetical protein